MKYGNKGARAVLSLAIVAFIAGCATPRSTPPGVVMPEKKTSLSDAHAASQEVEESKKIIDAGDTSAVIPRLLYTISKYPHTEAALEARYLLGVAYQRIGGYRDAIELYNEYLRLAPQGRYSKEASDRIARLSDEYTRKYTSPEKLDEQIRDLTTKVAADPGNAEYQMKLADLLWKRGDYGKAGKIYATLVGKNQSLATDPVIAARMEFLPNNEYVVLSPAEVERRQIEAQPLAVMNTAAFKSGEDVFTRTALYYSVTGQVVNRSDSVLYGVQVIITIYGFGNVVNDTTTVSIGLLNPGEIRAFSVRFSNFENIENISRYECVATFQR